MMEFDRLIEQLDEMWQLLEALRTAIVMEKDQLNNYVGSPTPEEMADVNVKMENLKQVIVDSTNEISNMIPDPPPPPPEEPVEALPTPV